MGRHNMSEEAFFDFIPINFFFGLIRGWGVHGHPVNPLWIPPPAACGELAHIILWFITRWMSQLFVFSRLL